MITHSWKATKAVGDGIDHQLWVDVLNVHYNGRVLAVVPSEDGKNPVQQAGVDAFCLLTNGSVVTVDFKVDTYTTDRVALEIESNSETGSPGWLVDKGHVNDVLMYYKVNKNLMFIIEMCDLRRLYWENQFEWHNKCEDRKEGFMMIRAKNKTYTTTCLGIPEKVLVDGLTIPGFNVAYNINRKDAA